MMPKEITKMSQKARWILPVTFLLAIIWIGSSAALAQAIEQTSPDMLAIQGHWIRTDAPYVIELRYAKDGSMQAAYFNPKSINVGKTETAEQGGMVQVMVELQDVNYPGSTYVLSYDRTRDILEGIYFHPATKQSYEVGFVRQVAQ
jgi:hypothetical protein